MHHSSDSVMSRSQPLSSFGATSLQHEASVLGRHTCAEAMRLCASSVVWLKSALRHRNEFSLKTKTLRLAACCVYVKETSFESGVLVSARRNLCVLCVSVVNHILRT